MVVLVAEGDDPFPRTGKVAIPEIPLAHGGGSVVGGARSGVRAYELQVQALGTVIRG